MPVMRDKNGTPIWDFGFNICNNELLDVQENYKFGRVSGLAAVEKTVWTGSTAYTFPNAALPMALASTNSVDVCTGTIVKAVEVQYLDNSWDQQTEVHCLNGRTPVTLSGEVLRINRMRFLANCNVMVNTGQIWLGTSDFTNGVPTGKYGHIESGAEQTYQGFYSVPRGYKVFIYDRAITVNEGKSAYIYARVRNNAAVYSGFPGLGDVFQHKTRYELFQTDFSLQNKVPFCFSERTDMEFRAQGEAGGDVNLTVEWSFILVGSSYQSSRER